MVGINTAVAGIGLGMAVPVNTTTRRIVSALMRDGRVRRAYLGLVTVPAPLSEPWRERIGRPTGLRVAEVVPGGPACPDAAAELIGGQLGPSRLVEDRVELDERHAEAARQLTGDGRLACPRRADHQDSPHER